MAIVEKQKQKGENAMGLFTGMKDAQVGAGGVWFLEGKYTVEILKVFTMRSRKSEDLFIVECRIVESNNDKRPEGGKASWCVKLSQDAAMGNIKGFIAAANGIDPTDDDRVNEEVTEEAVEFAVSDDNPLAGVTVGLECVEITTRSGNPFTKHVWDVAQAA